MPRIRTIKPEFWSDEDLSEISESSLLVAIAVLNLADDEGFFNANYKLMESFAYPLREPSMSMQDSIIELSNIGYLKMYKCTKGKKTIAQVVNFKKHQVISRPSPSKLRLEVDFSDNSMITHGVVSESYMGERKGKERNREGNGKGKEVNSTELSTKVDASVLPKSKEIFSYWCQIMDKSLNQCKLTPKRDKAIKARLKDYSFDDIKKAIFNCSKSSFHMGQNENGTYYNDVELICRTGEKLETFRDMTDVSNQVSIGTQRNINNLQDWQPPQ